MRLIALSVVLMSAAAMPAFAQSYVSPSPTDVPASGVQGLTKADRKKACTLVADNRHMTGLQRQRYRAACRGRPLPKG